MEYAPRTFDLDEAYDFLGEGLDVPAEGSLPQKSELVIRWEALDEAGRVVASLAGQRKPQTGRSFTEWLDSGAGERQDAAKRGVEDLAAMMEPALAALLYVCENGGDACAPAAALWSEYSAARTALLALAPLD